MKKIIIFTFTIVVVFASFLAYKYYIGSEEAVKMADPNTAQPVSQEDEDDSSNSVISSAMKKQVDTKYNKTTSTISISDISDDEVFARGTVNFTDETGGGIWLAVKTDNQWKLVFDGNGIVSCNIVNEYNFPVDMVEGCVDETNGEFVQR